jgi:hypothetical protein
MPIETFALVATGGKRSGCENGEGVGVAVAVGVDVGVGVAGGVTVGVVVAVAVAVGVAVDVGVGLAVAVGVGLDAVYSIVKTGGLALSRVSKRFAVDAVDSSPRTSQPKLNDRSFNHAWTSAIIWAEVHV